MHELHGRPGGHRRCGAPRCGRGHRGHRRRGSRAVRRARGRARGWRVRGQARGIAACRDLAASQGGVDRAPEERGGPGRAHGVPGGQAVKHTVDPAGP